MATAASPYLRHRFPPEIIAHCVLLYIRFPLSLRAVEEQCVPRVLITDKLPSYGVAHRERMPRVEHRKSKYLNNRAEHSHQPTRQRERAMQRFKSAGSAQRLLSAFSMISPHFRPRRHLLSAAAYRQEMCTRLQTWREVTQTAAVGYIAESRRDTRRP